MRSLHNHQDSEQVYVSYNCIRCYSKRYSTESKNERQQSKAWATDTASKIWYHCPMIHNSTETLSMLPEKSNRSYEPKLYSVNEENSGMKDSAILILKKFECN